MKLVLFLEKQHIKWVHLVVSQRISSVPGRPTSEMLLHGKISYFVHNLLKDLQ